MVSIDVVPPSIAATLIKTVEQPSSRRVRVWRKIAAPEVRDTSPMPADVAASLVGHPPLSPTASVRALAAPARGAAAAPGQFVMIKAGRGHDPLLRRPFSVFEVLRDERGGPTGISILNQRIGVSPGLVYAAQPGQRVDCLGPLGRPFTIVDPPTEAWM